MCDRDHPAIEYSECHEPLLSVVESVVQDRHRFAFKYLFDTDEIDTVIAEIGLPFGIVPVKLHRCKCNYRM